jgi:hypothetical protein
MTPEHLKQLRLEAWGPGIADDMVALFEHIEDQEATIKRFLDDRAKLNGSWNNRCKAAELKAKTLADFVLEIRDGFDCDTGANGVHAYRCRCCVAEELLGLPPHPAKDQRTMGG